MCTLNSINFLSCYEYIINLFIKLKKTIKSKHFTMTLLELLSIKKCLRYNFLFSYQIRCAFNFAMQIIFLECKKYNSLEKFLRIDSLLK